MGRNLFLNCCFFLVCFFPAGHAHVDLIMRSISILTNVNFYILYAAQLLRAEISYVNNNERWIGLDGMYKNEKKYLSSSVQLSTWIAYSHLILT